MGDSESECKLAQLEEAEMTLALVGIDPGTNGDNCPAVFLEKETGDLLFEGPTVIDPAVLAEVAGHSRIADGESVVRLPARMRQIILEAVDGSAGATIQRPDRSHDEHGCAPGDARRVHAE
jgi:hypothetical protein